MPEQNRSKLNKIGLIITAIFVILAINPILGFIVIALAVIFLKKNPQFVSSYLKEVVQSFGKIESKQDDSENDNLNINTQISLPKSVLPIVVNKSVLPIPLSLPGRVRLVKRKKYLQIALNSTLDQAREIIGQLPVSERILIEAGTPLIKIYGAKAVSQIKRMSFPGTYIVADNKCADLALREVEMMALAGANAATCLGVAPIETIDSFVEECQKFGLDSMIDMMNVDNALFVLKKLKKLPDVVVLHRGVDESEFSKEKQIPYYQIKQIKGNYDVLVSVAGGDTIKEVQRAVFNDADIVVVWKNFYQASEETAQLAGSFLKEIK